jgi:hypothetical protein
MIANIVEVFMDKELGDANRTSKTFFFLFDHQIMLRNYSANNIKTRVDLGRESATHKKKWAENCT